MYIWAKIVKTDMTERSKAQKAFRDRMRLQRCMEFSDSGIVGKCVTCGKIVTRGTSDCQAGHGVGGSSNSIYFEEDLVYIQCYRCNVALKGNYENFSLFLIKKFGMDWYENILKKRHETKKITKKEFEEMAKKEKILLKTLERKLN